MNQVPNSMRALVVEEKGKLPIFKEIPIPQPQNGQLLVKMDSAPINPSDLAFLSGNYQSAKPYPTVPGFEGSGTVVLSGGGVLGWSLVGKRVSVSANTQFGCYAEYCIVEATSSVEMDADLSFQQGACTFVNPLSVMAMLEITKTNKTQAVISTGAAGQLGRMMVRYFQANGVRVINVVRRDEQIEMLKKEGADLIFNSNDPDFYTKLKASCITLNANICFDALGGEMTGKILEVMPINSTVYVYGGLSLQPVSNVSITDLIFRKKSVTGFWLPEWLKTRNLLSQVLFIRKLKSLLRTQLKTDIAREFPLEHFKEAVDYYKKNMSAGKVLLRPVLSAVEIKQTEEGKQEIFLDQDQPIKQAQQEELPDQQQQQKIE